MSCGLKKYLHCCAVDSYTEDLEVWIMIVVQLSTSHNQNDLIILCLRHLLLSDAAFKTLIS